MTKCESCGRVDSSDEEDYICPRNQDGDFCGGNMRRVKLPKVGRDTYLEQLPDGRWRPSPGNVKTDYILLWPSIEELRWRDSRKEPLPKENTLVESATPNDTWDRTTVFSGPTNDWIEESGGWLWWRPLTPGPEEQCPT